MYGLKFRLKYWKPNAFLVSFQVCEVEHCWHGAWGATHIVLRLCPSTIGLWQSLQIILVPKLPEKTSVSVKLNIHYLKKIVKQIIEISMCNGYTIIINIAYKALPSEWTLPSVYEFIAWPPFPPYCHYCYFIFKISRFKLLTVITKGFIPIN